MVIMHVTETGVSKAIRDMLLHVQKLTEKKFVTIRTDGPKEFTMGNAKKFLDGNCTVLDETPPYFPQSNERAERMNRKVFKKARTIFSEPNRMCKVNRYQKLWPEAIRCVVHEYNRSLTRSSHKNVRNKTPFEI